MKPSRQGRPGFGPAPCTVPGARRRAPSLVAAALVLLAEAHLAAREGTHLDGEGGR